MHELSVTQALLDLALQEAQKAQARKIVKINLVVGELAGYVEECISFYFSLLCKDNIASEATLSFTNIPIKLRCRHCGDTFSPQDSCWACPHDCGGGIEVVGGREFYIESMEVE